MFLLLFNLLYLLQSVIPFLQSALSSSICYFYTFSSICYFFSNLLFLFQSANTFSSICNPFYNLLFIIHSAIPSSIFYTFSSICSIFFNLLFLLQSAIPFLQSAISSSICYIFFNLLFPLQSAIHFPSWLSFCLYRFSFPPIFFCSYLILIFCH